jgi:ABC-type multidrug transport system permease subunit
MRKILAILGKQLYIVYTDRNLLLIMLATPLALATIFGLVFGGTDGINIRDISVAIVNLDSANNADATFDSGQIFVDILVPEDAQITSVSEATAEATSGSDATPESTPSFAAAIPSDTSGLTCATESSAETNVTGITLFDLTDTVELNDVDEARAGVNNGTYTAAIIIPSDFSEKISYSPTHPQIEPTSIEVYASGASQITGGIVRSIVQSIADQLATGNITIAATIDTLVARAQQDLGFGLAFAGAATNNSFQPNFACAFTPAFNPVQVESQTVTGQRVVFNPLVSFGSGISIFFMLFTAQGAANAMLEEQRSGTLQRMLVTPTSRLQILIGQLGSGFVSSLVQITLLFLALTLIGTLINGRLTLIWGNNIPLIVLVLIAASLSVSGLGTLLAGISRTPDAASTAGSAINIVLGLLGGAFFPVQNIPEIRPFTVVSPVFWGTDAFAKLSQNIPDVGLNVVILVAQGLVMFLIGLWLFNRRLDV